MVLKFQDTFTDVDFTDLNLHQPDVGIGWTAHPLNTIPTGSIINNTLIGGSNNSWWYIEDIGTNDYIVTADHLRDGLTNADTVGNFIYARMSTVNTTAYYVRKTSDNDGRVILGKLVNGSNTEFQRFNFIGDSNGVLELSVQGTTIQGYWYNDFLGEWLNSLGNFQASKAPFASVTDSSIASGRAGLNPTNSTINSRSHFDNFSVVDFTNELNGEIESQINFTQEFGPQIFRVPLILNSTRRIARLPDGEFIKGFKANGFLTNPLVDVNSPTYYYYGGIDESGEWKVNRTSKSNINIRQSASEINNPTISNLSAAWSSRTSLTYG